MRRENEGSGRGGRKRVRKGRRKRRNTSSHLCPMSLSMVCSQLGVAAAPKGDKERTSNKEKILH